MDSHESQGSQNPWWSSATMRMGVTPSARVRDHTDPDHLPFFSYAVAVTTATPGTVLPGNRTGAPSGFTNHRRGVRPPPNILSQNLYSTFFSFLGPALPAGFGQRPEAHQAPGRGPNPAPDRTSSVGTIIPHPQQFGQRPEAHQSPARHTAGSPPSPYYGWPTSEQRSAAHTTAERRRRRRRCNRQRNSASGTR